MSHNPLTKQKRLLVDTG